MKILYIMFGILWSFVTGFAISEDSNTPVGILVSVACAMTAMLLLLAGV